MFSTIANAAILCLGALHAAEGGSVRYVSAGNMYTAQTTIYYQTTQPGRHFLHYGTIGRWEGYAPIEMIPSPDGGDFAAENGWFKAGVNGLSSFAHGATDLEFIVRTSYNGQDSWDKSTPGWHNEQGNYRAGHIGIWALSNLKYQSPLLAKTGVKNNEGPIRVLYEADSAPYVYYRACDGEWTKSPGAQMALADEDGFRWERDWFGYTFNASCVELAFHNNNGSWDSNHGNNYKIDRAGTWAFDTYLPRAAQ